MAGRTAAPSVGCGAIGEACFPDAWPTPGVFYAEHVADLQSTGE